MTNGIVIVGGGLAAARVATAFRKAGGQGAVTMLSADTDPPYNRPPLSKGFLRGEIEAGDVFVEPAERYAELGIDLRLESEVTAVDTKARTVTLAGGDALPYERLVLASGSLPRALGTPGEDLDGVHRYRTLARCALGARGGRVGLERARDRRRLHRHGDDRVAAAPRAGGHADRPRRQPLRLAPGARRSRSRSSASTASAESRSSSATRWPSSAASGGKLTGAVTDAGPRDRGRARDRRRRRAALHGLPRRLRRRARARARCSSTSASRPTSRASGPSATSRTSTTPSSAIAG